MNLIAPGWIRTEVTDPVWEVSVRSLFVQFPVILVHDRGKQDDHIAVRVFDPPGWISLVRSIDFYSLAGEIFHSLIHILHFNSPGR
ncbi:MAG: hypothetical protein OXP69_10950 [Spirochaetaceae bacterium]|nr:hypothetical protein [Spirochaetaceae bacterium]